MINKEEERLNYFGTTLFAVLFFLFIAVFSDKPARQPAGTSAYGLAYGLQLNTAAVVVTDAFQWPAFDKTGISLDKTSFHFYNAAQKIFADNCSIERRCIVQQEIRLLLKPRIRRLHSPRISSKGDDDQPDLS